MISVIITCYNEGEVLHNAINSVYNQTNRDFEIIIAQDFSDHSETNKIVNELEISGLKVVRSEQNIGPSGIRNLAIEQTNGDIIIPLDGDDELPVNSVELIHQAFEKYDIDLVFGNYILNDLANNSSSIIDCSVLVNEKSEINLQNLLQNWIILGMSPFKKSLWKKLKGYSMEFAYTCQDVDFQMRALLIDSKIRYINEVLYKWNRSVTGINSSLQNKEALNKCCFNNIELLDRCEINIYYKLDLCSTFNNLDRYRYYFKLYCKKEGKLFLFALSSILPPKLIPYLKYLL
jgi:glycosyltransferase involved in cell wall biosynthesis